MSNLNVMQDFSNREKALLQIEQRVDDQIERLEELLNQMECMHKYMQCTYQSKKHVNGREVNFLAFMLYVICQLRETNHERTAEAYESTLASFKKFLLGKDVCISAIDAELIKQYEVFLKNRGVAKNTSSFYMRVLRAVYNRAIERELVEMRNPFKHVYTGVDRTIKRALTIQDIKRIKSVDLQGCKYCNFARDMFMFSFYMRGMSYVDMAYLRTTNLSKGYISYRRRKTGQELSVKWEECMQEIVEKYKGQCCSDYLLPIIKRPDESRSQHKYGLVRINRYLREVARLAHISTPLTLYVARHSWASIARYKRIPLPVISESMGHDSERTTRIYLKSLDKSVIDKANRQILSEL